MRLYEILDGLRAIEAEIDRDNGELTPDTEAALNRLEGSLEVKCDNIAALIDEAEKEWATHDGLANEFKAKARAAEHKAYRLKEWLKAALLAAGRDKVKGERFTLAVQSNGRPSIRWDGETWDFPAEFMRTRVEPDGDKMREALKDGTLPEGFTVVKGTHLRIR